MTPIAAASAFVAIAAAAAPGPDAPVRIAIPNGGFEEGAAGWSIPADEGMSRVTGDRAATGQRSLLVKDSDSKRGSNVTSSPVAIEGVGAYELRGKHFPVSGDGLGVYVRVYDGAGRQLNAGDDHLRGLGGRDGKWLAFSSPFYTGEEARSLRIWIHSYSAAIVEGYLDDLELVRLPGRAGAPPWPAQYKIRPNERERLTAADVVGPDGVVYPNWRHTGVQGGIPRVRTVAHIRDFGGRADDNEDDSAALQRAVDSVGERGGGAVELAAGTYHLDRSVMVRHDGVVIRGRGAKSTKIIYRYAIHERGIDFFWPPAGSRLGPRTRVELHAVPRDLERMTISMNGKLERTWTRGLHSGNTFYFGRSGHEFAGKLPDGEHTLTGVAEYRGGRKVTHSIKVVLDRDYRDDRFLRDPRAAISFRGRGRTGPRLKLARDGARGATRLELESARDLAPGDRLFIEGPATDRWKALTKNVCRWGNYRRYEAVVRRVDGSAVEIGQPLRIEFPVVDGSYVQEVEPVERCGIEDLYVEQTEDLWISTVVFQDAWNSWARGVTVRKCGRFPVYGSQAKWCEIRDCVFDDAHFKGGGGTAYAGWENSWDCLMDGIETFKLRHAPLFQWAASGNVIRNGVFHDSDGQWHSGWTNENLFEQCVITSVRGNGGYGFGLWASPPEDAAHGPNGPRNVVYNCDVSSEKDGLWMGGMNECWLVLYNRFVVEKGPGVFAKTASFDHVIRGNVFVLKDGRSAMVRLATPDCSGVELVGNLLHGGSGRFSGGMAKPLVEEGNRAMPLAGTPPRPRPAVPSIYEWQQRNLR